MGTFTDYWAAATLPKQATEAAWTAGHSQGLLDQTALEKPLLKASYDDGFAAGVASVMLPPVTPPAVTNPSGIAMPVGDLPGWRQVLAEDFNVDVPLGGFAGTSTGCPNLPAPYKGQFGVYTSGWGDTAKKAFGKGGTYRPEKVLFAKNGMLQWSIQTVNGEPQVAVVLPLLARGMSFRVSICMRADRMPGYKAAILTWPLSDQWPLDGECDWPEADFDKPISGFVHVQGGAADGSDQKAFSTTALFQSWHVFTTEFIAGKRVAYLLDGVKIGEVTSRVPSTAHRYTLQIETALDAALPDPAVKGLVMVDWCAVWLSGP